MVQRQDVRFSREDALVQLYALGEDPSASRVDAVLSRIDVDAVRRTALAMDDSPSVFNAAVAIAREQVDAALTDARLVAGREVDENPDISSIDSKDRARWLPSCEPVHQRWQLAMHEPWLDNQVSRVVLIQSVFMATFQYPTGDIEARNEAKEQAIRFSARNALKRVELAGFQFFQCRDVVAFTAPLKAAGLVTGRAAEILGRYIDVQDTRSLEALLSKLSGYTPMDYSAAIVLLHRLERGTEPRARPARLIDVKREPARTMAQGKALLDSALSALSGDRTEWVSHGESASPWEYASISFAGRQGSVKVGVSDGGVVSVEGDPFTPGDRRMNVELDPIVTSLTAARDRMLNPEMRVATPTGASVSDLTVMRRDAEILEVSSSHTRGRCATVYKFSFSENYSIQPFLIPSYMQGITTEMIRQAVHTFVEREMANDKARTTPPNDSHSDDLSAGM
jgi:hypothetical protein